MRHFFILLILMSLILSCVSNQTRDVKKYTIEQFYQNTSIWGGSFAPDESNLLVTSNETGIYNVFALPLDGSKPEQLNKLRRRILFC